MAGCSQPASPPVDDPIDPVVTAKESVAGSLVVHCGTLIDGLNEEPALHQEVVIDKGRITAVRSIPDSASRADKYTKDLDDSPSHEDVYVVGKLPEGAAFLDLSDKVCLPGLINAHVHFDANPEDAADYSVYATRTAEDVLAQVSTNAKQH